MWGGNLWDMEWIQTWWRKNGRERWRSWKGQGAIPTLIFPLSALPGDRGSLGLVGPSWSHIKIGCRLGRRCPFSPTGFSTKWNNHLIVKLSRTILQVNPFCNFRKVYLLHALRLRKTHWRPGLCPGPACAVDTCEIKLFQKYFCLRLRFSEIILPKIISELFHRLIAAHEYFPRCSVSLKK